MTDVRQIALDAERLRRREEAQAYLREAFGFPDYYGNNLDALHDMLGETAARVVFYNTAALYEKYGYAGRVLRVCLDAAEENPRLTVTVAEK